MAKEPAEKLVKKNTFFSIWMSLDMRTQIARRARLADMPLEDWIIKVIEAELKRPPF